MRIGLMPSGGRGEYEIAGSHAGYGAADLEGWFFNITWPDGESRDSNLWLDPAGSGKPRLRSTVPQRFQMGRIMSSMLLLPAPRRALSETGSGVPIVRETEYVISRIGLGPTTSFAPIPTQVDLVPNYVEVRNQVGHELIGIGSRYLRIKAVYDSKAAQGKTIERLIDQHEQFMATNAPITAALRSIVDALIKSLASMDPLYVPGTDPLPALERRAGLAVPDGPSLPPPDQVGEDDFEVRAQIAQVYRLAKQRDAAARAFALAVKVAYGYRCAFCGLVFGGVEGVTSGIDAAHILAWSSYNLDVPANGIALCKRHHWAFDASVMTLEHQSGSYRTCFTDLAHRFPTSTRDALGTHGLVLPDAWLPAEPALRPSPKYLRKLYEDLSVPS